MKKIINLISGIFAALVVMKIMNDQEDIKTATIPQNIVSKICEWISNH